MTLEEIAEELHGRGYRYPSGRPFVDVKANGTRKANISSLARRFHNWFYAGSVISEPAKIPPKTVSGNGNPLFPQKSLSRDSVSWRGVTRIALQSVNTNIC